MSMETAYDYSVFDFDGTPITLLEWATIGRTGWAMDENYKGYRIRTSWTGVDSPRFQADTGRFAVNTKDNVTPMIYQSYVWNPDQIIAYADRAATKEEAIKLHEEFKKQIDLKSRLTTI